MLLGLAFVILVGGLALAFATLRTLGLSGGMGAVVAGLGAVVIPMIIRARQHLARGGEEAMRRDPRPHILFLRQFSDDGALRGLHFWRSRRRVTLISGWYVRTYEERVARAVKNQGPLVAIGRPTEDLPTLGAARIYSDDQSWQAKVDQLAQDAQVVLLQIGETAGIRWEVERLVTGSPPVRLILCLPVDEATGEGAHQARYQNFLALNGALFPMPLPPLIGRAQFIYFEDDWTPRLLEPGPASRAAIARDMPGEARRALRRTLFALNEEFLLTKTPYAVRTFGLVLLILGLYLPLGAMLFIRTAAVLQETTLFGLLPDIETVTARARLRLEGLRDLLAGVAATIGEPGSLRLDTDRVAPMPPPLYDRRRSAFDTDIMMVEALTDLAARPAFDLHLAAELSLALHWAFASAPYGEGRAGSTLRDVFESAARTRYLAVVRAVPGQAPGPETEAAGQARFEVFFVDLTERQILLAFELPVRGPDLWSATRRAVLAELARRTGGTFEDGP